jgi:phospholipase/carboxylesterase
VAKRATLVVSCFVALACTHEEPPLRAAPARVEAPAPAVAPVLPRSAVFGGVETELRGEGALAEIVVHGYGAPGTDLVPLGERIASALPVRVAIPAAPRTWVNGGEGRAWYERGTTELDAEVERAAGELAAVRDGLVAEGRDAHDVIVMGFSQGATLSIECAQRWPDPPRAIVVLSGRVLPRFAEHWSPLAGMPVFVSHGRSDPVIPFTDGEATRDAATAAGAQVTFVPFDGPHAIPDAVEAEAVTFLRGVVGVP